MQFWVVIVYFNACRIIKPCKRVLSSSVFSRYKKDLLGAYRRFLRANELGTSLGAWVKSLFVWGMKPPVHVKADLT